VTARRTKIVVLRPGPYLLVMLGIFTGCATPPNKDHGSAIADAVGSDVQCHVATISGTFVKKKVCSTQSDRDAEQRSDDDLQYRAAMAPQGIDLKSAASGH
jgi:hypothetical protein